MLSSLMPRFLAYAAAAFSEARNSDAAPSVTCEQSEILMRPPMIAVELVVRARVVLGHVPVARLRQRVALGVRVVDRGDVRQVLVLEAEALVVLVAEPAEELRETGTRCPSPRARTRRRCRGSRRRLRIDGLHLLDADDHRQVVAPGLDLGRGGEDRDAAGGAGGFVARGRQAGEARGRCRRGMRRDGPAWRRARRRSCRRARPRRPSARIRWPRGRQPRPRASSRRCACSPCSSCARSRSGIRRERRLELPCW